MEKRDTNARPANKWLARLKSRNMSVLPVGSSTLFSTDTYLPELSGENQDENSRVGTDKTDKTPTPLTAVLDLARSYDWGIAVIVGGGWIGSEDDEEGRVLRLGEVVGGDEAHWRAFASRASDDQLREAVDLMTALAWAA